ncbi:MAG: 5-formyltetrahydrofolate cyclo-ligase, partial [bacterium (Candidatus Ratteibacteria) CG23_combo_of_CG06-09_8_20_14_all_48_7]
YHIQSPDDLAPGHFGILEPKKNCPVLVPSEIELVVMPG